MGIDAIMEKRGVSVGEETVVKKEPLTGGVAVRLVVSTFLGPDLTKEKVEGVMEDCLPAIDGWLSGGQEDLSSLYDPQWSEVDDKEWEGFLGKRCKPIRFSFREFTGGRLRLCVQRRKRDDGVMVWLYDPDPTGDAVGVSEMFNIRCKEIFENDDKVTIETSSGDVLDRLIFRWKIAV